MRIVFTGGGTGGHLTPIIAVAREIKRIAEEERILDLELYYLGPDAIPEETAAREGIIAGRVAAGKMRRYFSFQNFTDALRMAWGVLQALWKMFLIMPDAVFSKGGYGSVPVAIASRIYRIPIMAHESDAVPGAVNRWVGGWARRTAVSFPSAVKHFPPDQTALIGVPVRSRIVGGSRDAAREVFGAFSDRPVVFVIGGSQGAVILNRAVIEVLGRMLEEFEVIHAVGPKHIEDVRLETMPIIQGREQYYHPVGFMTEDEMRSSFALADLVVSRAGATAIYEIAANAKPAILVPIKHSAQNHQRANAYAYTATGAGIVIEEDNLTPSVLLHEIKTLMADPERRATMARAAATFARPDAARIIAKELLSLALH